MFHKSSNKLKLPARNEGKIKSYESCVDVRAWSHDIQARDRYLRDWIKGDMPVCVLPVCTVASFLRTMTWRCRGRATPRCHPDCKSKVVLDSICTSCHAMKECLKNDENFEKYFEEEEFETTHWPCERCLDALKSIKMFWKIILEKIFRITIPISDEFESACSGNESLKDIAKSWQEEMVQQALFVKNLTPFMESGQSLSQSSPWETTSNYMKKNSNLKSVHLVIKGKENSTERKPECKDKSTNTVFRCKNDINKRSTGLIRKKLSKCTSVKFKTLDVGCEACDVDKDEVIFYKNNLDFLQQRYNVQSDELGRLKRENISLKLQLQNIANKKNTIPSYTPIVFTDSKVNIVPQPYESYIEEKESGETVKDIDSEMIITLKSCENKHYKHVSMLKVLHKTNGPMLNELEDQNCINNEDPIKILSKVHKTFGAIVKRELAIAKDNRLNAKEVVINASHQGIHTSRSVPSCTSLSFSTNSHYMSTMEV